MGLLRSSQASQLIKIIMVEFEFVRITVLFLDRERPTRE
jgi:hypothetical protein